MRQSSRVEAKGMIGPANPAVCGGRTNVSNVFKAFSPANNSSVRNNATAISWRRMPAASRNARPGPHEVPTARRQEQQEAAEEPGERDLLHPPDGDVDEPSDGHALSEVFLRRHLASDEFIPEREHDAGEEPLQHPENDEAATDESAPGESILSQERATTLTPIVVQRVHEPLVENQCG